jgi:hypothetical protein
MSDEYRHELKSFYIIFLSSESYSSLIAFHLLSLQSQLAARISGVAFRELSEQFF